MSRARGKVPSKQFLPNGRHPYGDHGEFIPDVGVPYVRREGHHHRDVIARPRKSGVVGPELDYSVRTSYWPVGFMQNLRRYRFDTDYRGILGTGKSHGLRAMAQRVDARHRPPKGFCLVFMPEGDQYVRYWTKFANLHGIKYLGDRYYEFPKRMLGTLDRRSGIYYTSNSNPFYVDSRTEFALLKCTGSISHKRSEAAKVQRKLDKARKAARQAVVEPRQPKDLFVRRAAVSQREIAYSWFKAGKPVPYQEYKRKFERPLTLFPKRCKLPISSIVFESIKSIYSRPVRVRTDLWFEPKLVSKTYVIDLPRFITRSTSEQITKLRSYAQKAQLVDYHVVDDSNNFTWRLGVTGPTLDRISSRSIPIERSDFSWRSTVPGFMAPR